MHTIERKADECYIRTFHPGCVAVLKRRFFDAPDAARQRAQVLVIVYFKEVHPTPECRVHLRHKQMLSYVLFRLVRKKREEVQQSAEATVAYLSGGWLMLSRRYLPHPWACSSSSLLWRPYHTMVPRGLAGRFHWLVARRWMSLKSGRRAKGLIVTLGANIIVRKRTESR